MDRGSARHSLPVTWGTEETFSSNQRATNEMETNKPYSPHQVCFMGLFMGIFADLRASVLQSSRFLVDPCARGNLAQGSSITRFLQTVYVKEYCDVHLVF